MFFYIAPKRPQTKGTPTVARPCRDLVLKISAAPAWVLACAIYFDTRESPVPLPKIPHADLENERERERTKYKVKMRARER